MLKRWLKSSQGKLEKKTRKTIAKLFTLNANAITEAATGVVSWKKLFLKTW